ncbi:MAG: pyridoxal phosphate-dependent aminotransferase [Gemmatimonadetes bacterium]|nr:MAG: pyridoxal phosphate-dependent aminotransferase [Gemmatimonadota bacterium]
MRLSERVLNMPASPIRKLMPYANAAKAQGRHVYHLNIGQPDIKTPEGMLNALKNLDMSVIAYGPSEGLAEYREALPDYYARHNIHIQPEDILVTTAGSEAIIFTMMAIADPGDEIIIPEPFYTNYNGFADMGSIRIVPLTTKAEEAFALPPREVIESKITNRTRAIMVCNPGNPTGAVYTRKEVEMLVDLAKQYNLFLVADEVYREFVYDGYKHTSVLEYPEIGDRAIMVDSVSKRYSACGARIGCIISKNQQLIQNILKMGQARLCPPTIEQIAAKAALDTPNSYFEEVLQEYQTRRNLVYEALRDIPGVICEKPRGAFYVIAKLPVENAEDFAIYLLEHVHVNNETVMIAPAAGFYATPGVGQDEVRIAYVLNTKDLANAMSILKIGLEQYNANR